MSGEQRQPTEEEMQAYVEQLRAADPSEIITQAFTMLGAAAETKLGRPDARLLIDGLAGLVDAVEGGVDSELAQGMRNGLSQLQQLQVQAEAEVRASGGDAAGGGEAEGASGQPGGQSSPSDHSRTGDETRSGQSATDRLWIPGQ